MLLLSIALILIPFAFLDKVFNNRTKRTIIILFSKLFYISWRGFVGLQVLIGMRIIMLSKFEYYLWSFLASYNGMGIWFLELYCKCFRW